MKVGKLDWNDLQEIIDENKSVKRDDVRVRSGIGEDCSVINFGEYECVVSTDPITGTNTNIGKLAVHINCNDIASCGVEPLGILVTILAPEETTLLEIKNIMKEIDEETKELNVEILGGHTEITKAVNKIVVSCTAIGRTKKGKAVVTSGAKLGDDIIVTKDLCMEGSAIAINDYFHRLEGVLTKAEIEEVKGYTKNLSVVKEGVIAGEFGVNSMHDITEGGILGAIFEIAIASEKGFKIYKDKMPITKATNKICAEFKIDPLRFISSGSMLITTDKGEQLLKKLFDNGIKAKIIGNITNEKGILFANNKEEVVSPPDRDELFKMY